MHTCALLFVVVELFSFSSSAMCTNTSTSATRRNDNISEGHQLPNISLPDNYNYTGTNRGKHTYDCPYDESFDVIEGVCKPTKPAAGGGGSNTGLIPLRHLPTREGTLERKCLNSSYIFVKDCSIPWALKNGSYYCIPNNHTYLVAINSHSDEEGTVYEILCFSARANEQKGHDPIVCLHKNISFGYREDVIFSFEMICLSLDILACLVYFITFIFHKGIRTVFGQLVINLILVITLGDVFYVISQRLPEKNMSTEGFCIAVAIFTHYLYLARFTWMSILSIDIAKTFYLASQLMPTPDPKRSRNMFIIFTVLAYTVPAIIVIITICLNYTVENSVMYGRTIFGTCWMGTQLSISLTFVLPIAVTIFINILLSIYSIVTLFRVRNVGIKRTKELKRLFVDCRVVFGILSLLGVTWIFGFLALIPTEDNNDYESDTSSLSWAYYPFTLLSTTQAVVICIAFLLKKEVLDFYIRFAKCIKLTVCYRVRNQSQTSANNLTGRRSKQPTENILVNTGNRNPGFMPTSPLQSPMHSPV